MRRTYRGEKKKVVLKVLGWGGCQTGTVQEEKGHNLAVLLARFCFPAGGGGRPGALAVFSCLWKYLKKTDTYI